MKLNAIGAVAECYCEHAVIAEFASESGISVFTESDDNIFKKAWNATKEFFSKVWEWLKGVVRGLISIFTRSSVDRLILKLEEAKTEGKLKDENNLTDIDLTKIDANKVLDLVERFSNAIKTGGESSNATAIKGFIDEAEGFLKKDTLKEKFKYDKDSTATSTYQAVIDLLKTMSKMDVPSKGRKLLKKLDFDKSNYKKGGTGDDKDKIDKDLVKSIKKAANLVAKAYDAYVSNMVKLVNKVLKKNLKEEDYKTRNDFEKEQNKALDKARSNYELGSGAAGGQGATNATESYEENTDGYYFL
jgi:hypothetical protein